MCRLDLGGSEYIILLKLFLLQTSVYQNEREFIVDSSPATGFKKYLDRQKTADTQSRLYFSRKTLLHMLFPSFLDK